MRLLFIRHGDPDYASDCLNEIGRNEAKALCALRSSTKMHLGTCYASPLGRAQETAAITLGRAIPGARGAAAAVNCRDILTTLDWLREFPAQVDVNDATLLQDAYYIKTESDGSFKKRIVWDMYPSYFTEHPAYSDYEAWRGTLVALNSDLLPIYDSVISSFDELLAEHGYVRDVPLQSFCMPTSSVTEVYTEERQRGIANFRATRIGDTTHLTMAGLRTERLPHSALFTEVYSDFTQRHD